MSDRPLFPDDERPDPEHEDRPPPPARPGAPGFQAPREPGEGVRLIPPEKAAEAAERDDVAQRRGGDVPRYGDRPEPPRADVKPSVRLPLPGGASPGEPLISLDPPSDEVVLPHWTQPGTGEVPRVIVGDDVEPDEDDASRWAASGAGPRWRDQHAAGGGDEHDFADDLAHDEESRLGALDTESESSEHFLRFNDLNVPAAEEHRITREPPPQRPAPPSVAQPQHRPTPPEPRSGGGGTGARNMGQAIGVGVGLAALALVLAWAGAGWLLILAEVAIVLAAVEYFAALRRAGLEPPTLLGLVAVAALPLAAYARGDAAIPLVLFLLAAFGVLWYLAGIGRGRIVRDLGATFLAVVHVGVLGAFAALLLRIGPVGETTVSQGVSITLVAIVAAVAYDVGGLFAGSRFGRTALSAASPNKTWEGLGGGMGAAVVAVLVACFIFGLTPFSFLQALVFGIVCAAAAVVGDLGQSLVKRDLGLKDMGSLLPGHGGIFDRFDSLLFVLPVAYYTVRVFYF